MTTTAVEVKKTAGPLEVLRCELEKQRDAIAQILPRTLTPERMIKLMIVAASREPKLLECSKESILLSFMRAVELGLEPNSPLGLAYIIPYWNGKAKKTEAQFQLGYKGLLALIRRSDEVESVNAYVVHENDKFSISLGDDAHITHQPTVKGDPGEVIGAYMVAKIKGGQTEREWMTAAEIMRIRDRSQAVQAGKKFNFKTPWDTDLGEMCRKTVLKRGGKRLPISTEIAEIIERDNRTEFGGNGGGLDLLPIATPKPLDAGRADQGESGCSEDATGAANPTEETDQLWDEAYALGQQLGYKDPVCEAKANEALKGGADALRQLIANLKELVAGQEK